MDNSDSMAWLVAILAIFWWLLQLMRGKGRWEINVTLISLFGCSVLIQQQQFIASRQHLSPFEELGNRSLPTLGYVHSALSPMLFDQSQSTPPPRRQKFSDVDTAASRCEYAPKIVHVSDSLGEITPYSHNRVIKANTAVQSILVGVPSPVLQKLFLQLTLALGLSAQPTNSS
jgi:hypothetical protein